MFEKLDELERLIDDLGGELHDVSFWPVDALERLSNRLIDLKLKIHRHIEMVDAMIVIKRRMLELVEQRR